MKKFFYTFWISLYPILIYTGIQVVLGVVIGSFGALIGFDPYLVVDLIKENILLLTTVSAIFAFVFLILFFYFDCRKGRVEKRGNISISDFVMAIIGGAGIAILLNIIIGLTKLADYDSEFMEVSESLTSPTLMVTLVCAGFIIPIVEEIVFRGLVFNRIKYQYNYVAAMIISAFAFGIFHGNMVQGIYATILGICLAYVYNKTKSIFIPIFIHIGANTIVILYGKLAENEENILWLLLAIVISLVCAVIGTVYFIKRKVERRNEDIEYSGTML